MVVEVAPRFLSAASQLRTALHSHSGLALRNTLTRQEEKIGELIMCVHDVSAVGSFDLENDRFGEIGMIAKL